MLLTWLEVGRQVVSRRGIPPIVLGERPDHTDLDFHHAMDDLDTTLPELSQLIEQRLVLVRNLAASLESSTLPLVRNDAEAIARGAAHQAELCRQWSHLEDALRPAVLRPATEAGCGSPGRSDHFSETERCAQLQAEWNTLGARIRYLTRVHWSLLRHLERSLGVLGRVVDSCGATYKPKSRLLRTESLKDVPNRSPGVHPSNNAMTGSFSANS